MLSLKFNILIVIIFMVLGFMYNSEFLLYISNGFVGVCAAILMYRLNRNTIERIICASIHIDDGQVYHNQPVNIESGFVICGRRHFNCLDILRHRISDIDKTLFRGSKGQGFLTNKNRHVDRKEAAKIAYRAMQINKMKRILMSEDLY